jgi:DNA polymerase I
MEASGVTRGDRVAVAISSSSACIAFVSDASAWVVATDDPASAVAALEAALRPRWVWWTAETPMALACARVRVATCWDVAAVHRLLFGGWRAEPARVWAVLNRASTELPSMGQLGLLDDHGDEGDDPENPVRPDGHLRPEWVSGGWSGTPARAAHWAALALQVHDRQKALIAALPGRNGAMGAARSESAAEVLCAELTVEGLPISVSRAGEIIGSHVGPRPLTERDEALNRERRDERVLRHAPPGTGADLRNPAHVRAMLTRLGIDVADTRKWRLEPFRESHPLVDALLTWRKAERISTTYGYAWLDEHVGADGRLRGGWTACDGAAGRMTAQVGLHNLPAEMRDAVIAEPGFVFVHADLGQIEPRVLAAVSGDNALAAATAADDLYAPVAERLRVERAVAKVAVLAAMYGQTSGAAGEALRGMEAAYPVAMQFLRDADRCGQAGIDVRTYGGRLVRMGFGPAGPTGAAVAGAPVDRSAGAARGRYARNAVIQGAAAELFKAWAVMVRARVAPLGASIVLCLHDELLVHAPSDRAAEVSRLLEEALPEAAYRWMPEGRVRYVAKASVISRWSEAKG